MIREALKKLNLEDTLAGNASGTQFWEGNGEELLSHSPVDGSLIGRTRLSEEQDYRQIVDKALEAQKEWAAKPAPLRGEIVRQYGQILRENKAELGQLVSYEMGKSLQEGLGEVQEMIDICDFAVGLSRQLYGLSMHSERPEHRMFEQWHPLGIVGVISAFNFPVAVWSWNATIALVCGNVVLWKPSEKTPLCSIACQKLFAKVLKNNNIPEGVISLIQGDASIGELMSEDPKVALLSATGSTRMGKSVAKSVAARLGKYLLELGGNNAIIVSNTADIKIALPGIVFGAVGTCGQRCTSTRRLIVHSDIYETLKQKLVSAYEQLKIGNPLDQTNHVGPLIDEDAVAQFIDAQDRAIAQGGKILFGGERLDAILNSSCYVRPCLIEIPHDADIVHQETFAPILYLHRYNTLDEAVAIQNSVPQGLSSAIFTTNIHESELFLSQKGSDCGIANVNIGTSGAEIGGAFGGEKETGGGRESGSDAWKAYMRRQTCTVNYGAELPLAQGIEFHL